MPEFPEWVDDPEFLPNLYREAFATLGTSAEAYQQSLVVQQAVKDAVGGRTAECAPETPPDVGASGLQIMAAMIRVNRRYAGAGIQVGLAGRGHALYPRVLGWVNTLGCDHPSVHRLTANTVRYLLWIDRQPVRPAAPARGSTRRRAPTAAAEPYVPGFTGLWSPCRQEFDPDRVHPMTSDAWCHCVARTVIKPEFAPYAPAEFKRAMTRDVRGHAAMLAERDTPLAAELERACGPAPE